MLKNFRPRQLLIIDVFSYTAAFVAGMLLRYGELLTGWHRQLYSMIYVFLLFALLVQYLVSRRAGGQKSFADLDPVQCVTGAVKNGIVIFLLLILLLFATRSSHDISRLFLGYLFVAAVPLDVAMRLVLRGRIRRELKNAAEKPVRRIALVTTPERHALVKEHLEKSLSPSEEIRQVIEVPGDGSLASFQKTDQRTVPWHLPDRECTDVLLYLPDYPPEELERVRQGFARTGCVISVALTLPGTDIPPKLVRQLGDLAVAEFVPLTDRCPVLGVNYVLSNVEAAVTYVRTHLDMLRGGYLCFSNVHTTVMAHDNEEYRAVQNGAELTFPDGAPVAKAQRMKGFSGAERVAGPDFMGRMFRDTMDGRVGHYFYGSTQETLDRLRESLEKNYPGIRICGMYSPPFRPTTPEEDAEDMKRINESGADIVWIGLGAPKQENWMAAHKEKLTGVMAGVGAGFNFYAGTVKRAPVWVQRIGLEWFYRLCQEPKKLFKRYVTTNLRFLWLLAGEMTKRSKN